MTYYLCNLVSFMKKKLSTNRSFGLLLSVILLFTGLYLYGLKLSNLILISIITLFLSLVTPNVYRFPNKLWIKFGLVLGKIINPVICFLLYFLVVGPTRIILDVFRIKLIYKTKQVKINSYWIKRKENHYQNFNTQF